MPVLIPDGWSGRIIPQFVFIIVLYHGVYMHRHTALLFGLGFGLLQDIVYYGFMIGPHTFTMALLGYLFGLLFSTRNTPMIYMMMITIVASFANQAILYGVYRLFSLHQYSFQYALMEYMLPSLIVQLVFSIIVYVPMRKWFEGFTAINATNEEQG